MNMYVPDMMIKQLVTDALTEDLGLGGDITTLATIDADHTSTYELRSRADGVVCGLGLARLTFQTVDSALEFTGIKQDGARVKKGDLLARITGRTHSILTGERVALNFLGRMSGIASLTRAMVDAAKPHSPMIACSRKTTPLLRMVEKYAVTCGGGATHRMRLDDCIMIKDNHIAANGGDIRKTLERAKNNASHTIKIEIEVDTLDQFKEVLKIGIADIVMLDNMSVQDLKSAVKLNGGRFILEASGNVNLKTIAEIAASGVDVISVGALTHSAPNFDIGLDAINTAQDQKLFRLG